MLLKNQSFSAAAEAFEAANLANGEPDPSIDLYLLQARFIAADGRLDDASRAVAARLLERVPNQPAVLEMQAIDAMRGGRYQEAVVALNQLLGLRLAPGQRAALEAGLQQARASLADSRDSTSGPALDIAIELNGDTPPDAHPVCHRAPRWVVECPLPWFDAPDRTTPDRSDSMTSSA